MRRASRGKKGKRQSTSPLGRTTRGKTRHESSKRRRNPSTSSVSQGRKGGGRKYKKEHKKKRPANEQPTKIPTERPRKRKGNKALKQDSESETDNSQRKKLGEGWDVDHGWDQPTRKTFPEAQTKQKPTPMACPMDNNPDPDECLKRAPALSKSAPPDHPLLAKLEEGLAGVGLWYPLVLKRSIHHPAHSVASPQTLGTCLERPNRNPSLNLR